MTDPLLIEIPRVLSGNGIELRAYTPADAKAIEDAVIESQSELQKVFGWAAHLPSLDQRAAGLTRGAACWLLRTELAYGILSSGDNVFLGDTGIFNPDWNVRSFEFGYWLRTSAVGNGYATEAVRLLMDLAFGLLEARRVYIQCDSENERSKSLPIRLGFEHEGTLRQSRLRPDGEPMDLVIFGMTTDGWKKGR